MIQDGCSICKHVREHAASFLPFQVIESATGKPFRIGGIATADGMSRNFKVCTPEELRVFAEKLINVPMWPQIRLLAKSLNAHDVASRCLLYEAE